MVPIFTKFFYPVLKFLENGTPQNLKSTEQYVSEYFHLSDEDRQEKIICQNIVINTI